MYGNINNSLPQKKALARSLGLPNHLFLESWLKAISHIRNICAHHSRLWDKKLSTIPRKLGSWTETTETNKIYLNLCCIKYLLDNIKRDHDFAKDLINLTSKYQGYVDLGKMSFPKDWKGEKLWKN